VSSLENDAELLHNGTHPTHEVCTLAQRMGDSLDVCMAAMDL
jgi:hypothetical protein